MWPSIARCNDSSPKRSIPTMCVTCVRNLCAMLCMHVEKACGDITSSTSASGHAMMMMTITSCKLTHRRCVCCCSGSENHTSNTLRSHCPFERDCLSAGGGGGTQYWTCGCALFINPAGGAGGRGVDKFDVNEECLDALGATKNRAGGAGGRGVDEFDANIGCMDASGASGRDELDQELSAE